jgi:hypothetical protein
MTLKDLSLDECVAIVRDHAEDAMLLSAALVKVRYARLYDLEPHIVRCLSHPEPIVHEEALVTLVGTWGRAQYVPLALRMLFEETEATTLYTVACALLSYLLDHPEALGDILPSLLRAADGTPCDLVLDKALETIRRFVPAALPGEAVKEGWTLDEARAIHARIRWDALTPYRPSDAMPQPKHHRPEPSTGPVAVEPASPFRWKDPDARPTVGAVRELVHGLAAEARSAPVTDSELGRTGLKALRWAGLDGLEELEPQVVECLSHPDGDIRGEGIFVLVGRWGRETHLERAKEMMFNDRAAQVVAAQALNLFLADHPAALEEVFPALLRAMEQADNGQLMASGLEVILRMFPDALPGERLPPRRRLYELEELRGKVRWEVLRRFRWN